MRSGQSPSPAASGPAPRISVVVVTWREDSGLDDCLGGLANQTVPADEIVVADNGDVAGRVDGWLGRMPVRHLPMGANRGPSAARNRGAAATAGDLLLFLDDDGVPEPGWVQAYRDLFEDDSVAAARGRIEPRRGHVLNELARAYDLGPDVRPSVINTEGNCAIRRSVFDRVGGFNEDMYGHEGAEISIRIVDRLGDGAVVYTPDAVIRHDYADGFGDYVTKRFRHGSMLRHLERGVARRAAARSVHRSPWTGRRLAMTPVKAVGVGAEIAGWVWSHVSLSRGRGAIRS